MLGTTLEWPQSAALDVLSSRRALRPKNTTNVSVKHVFCLTVLANTIACETSVLFFPLATLARFNGLCEPTRITPSRFLEISENFTT